VTVTAVLPTPLLDRSLRSHSYILVRGLHRPLVGPDAALGPTPKLVGLVHLGAVARMDECDHVNLAVAVAV
jgi:hypothetical protein